MKPPLTTEARPTPLCDAFDKDQGIFYKYGNALGFARDLERSNQVLTEALEESERLRKLSVVLVADFHALRASEERLAIALSEAQRDLELGSPINAATTIRRALQRPTP